MKDKQISEEDLLDELDTMYQRVADIEKEEAEQAPSPLPPPQKQKIKPIQKKRRPYRTIVIAASVFFIVLASLLAITIFDPTTLLQRLKTGNTQPATIVTPPAPSKRHAVAPSPANPLLLPPRKNLQGPRLLALLQHLRPPLLSPLPPQPQSPLLNRPRSRRNRKS
jgi:hypothetical protein